MAGGLIGSCIDIISWHPTNCPKVRLAACAELLARINISLIAGSFEMSFNEYYIKCRTTIHHAAELPSMELLKKMLTMNVRTMDQFIQPIEDVILKRATPVQALQGLRIPPQSCQLASKTVCRKIMIPKFTNNIRYRLN